MLNIGPSVTLTLAARSAADRPLEDKSSSAPLPGFLLLVSHRPFSTNMCELPDRLQLSRGVQYPLDLT